MLKLLQSASRTAFPALFAAVCVLFAAQPLQAEETYDVTVTLSVTVADDGTATLSASATPDTSATDEVGFQWQDREGSAEFGDSWWNLGSNQQIDRDFWFTDGPYYVRARAWKVSNDGGERTTIYSDPSAEVEVVLPSE